MARHIPLLILDIDGTVRQGFDEMGRFVNGPEDVVVFPDAVTRMKEWRGAGGLILGVSNQGGVALGHVSAESVGAAMDETQRQTGNLFHMMTWCPHHPNGGSPLLARCWCRKPSPGGVVASVGVLERQHGVELPPYMFRMVGDRPEDEECARLAGADFTWAKDWRAGRWAPRGDSNGD